MSTRSPKLDETINAALLFHAHERRPLTVQS